MLVFLNWPDLPCFMALLGRLESFLELGLELSLNL